MMADLSWDSLAIKGHDRLATPLTAPFAVAPPVTSYTCMKSVVPATVPASAPAEMVRLPKLLPWTLLQPFILEHKLVTIPTKLLLSSLLMTSRSAMAASLVAKDYNSLIVQPTWCLHFSTPKLSAPL